MSVLDYGDEFYVHASGFNLKPRDAIYPSTLRFMVAHHCAAWWGDPPQLTDTILFAFIYLYDPQWLCTYLSSYTCSVHEYL